MVGNCANPNCSRPFLYLRHGRLYVADVLDESARPRSRRREYFWLCEQCVPRYTMTVDASKGAVCVERCSGSSATCPEANSRDVALGVF